MFPKYHYRNLTQVSFSIIMNLVALQSSVHAHAKRLIEPYLFIPVTGIIEETENELQNTLLLFQGRPRIHFSKHRKRRSILSIICRQLSVAGIRMTVNL